MACGKPTRRTRTALVTSSSLCSDRLAQQSVAVLVHRFTPSTSTNAVENNSAGEQRISTVSQVVVRKDRSRACPQAYAVAIHVCCGKHQGRRGDRAHRAFDRVRNAWFSSERL